MSLFDTPSSAMVNSTGRTKPMCTLFADGRSIDNIIELVSVQGSGEANIQIDSTFSGDILITAFGQKVVPITLKGIARTLTCPPAGQTQTNMNINEFYKKYNAGDNKKTPVMRMVFDNNIFEGALVSLTLSPFTESSTALPAYVFQLAIMGGIK
jgi:hypothetical protein